MCLTNPHAVSQRNKRGTYLNDKCKSAASRTDSCNVKNFDAAVTYNIHSKTLNSEGISRQCVLHDTTMVHTVV